MEIIILIIIAVLIAIISLIFTLEKKSKTRKFLIFFLFLTFGLTAILGIIIYSNELKSQQLRDEKEQRKAQQQELWKTEYSKIKVNFNIQYSNNHNLTPDIYGYTETLEINLSNSAQIKGRIVNNSNLPIEKLTLKYIIKDCAAECLIVGQGNEQIRMSIPVMQARDFSFSIGYRQQIKFKGKPQIEIYIEDITSEKEY